MHVGEDPCCGSTIRTGIFERSLWVPNFGDDGSKGEREVLACALQLLL
jgi:hypothetical protein